MDIQADIQRTYRNAFEAAGEKTIAFVEAAMRFEELAGYSPDRPVLERLLRGAMLGGEHPLMRLLDQPVSAAKNADRLSASGLDSSG